MKSSWLYRNHTIKRGSADTVAGAGIQICFSIWKNGRKLGARGTLYDAKRAVDALVDRPAVPTTPSKEIGVTCASKTL